MAHGLMVRRYWKRDGTWNAMPFEQALRNIKEFGDPPVSRAKAAALLALGKRVDTKTAYFVLHYGDDETATVQGCTVGRDRQVRTPAHLDHDGG